LNAEGLVPLQVEQPSNAKEKNMSRMKMVNKVFRFAYGAYDTVVTLPSDVNGWINKMIVVMPAFSVDTPTAVITITDPESITVFTSAALYSGTTTTLGDLITAADYGDVPIGDHPWTITCTLSNAPGGTGGTVLLAMYLKT
jgi:hypothetical protein